MYLRILAENPAIEGHAVSRLAVLTVAALILGGCAMTPPSELNEYKAKAEQLQQELREQIPDGITDGEPHVDSDAGYGDVSGAGKTADAPAWWRIRDSRNLIGDVGTSQAAAEALDEYLVANGWIRGESEDGGNGVMQDSYHRAEDDPDNGWTIDVQYVIADSDMAETLALFITSPITVRGPTPPAQP